MYNATNIKCADCGDIFRAEYDSRKQRQDEYKCKCGKLRGYLDSYCSFSYNRDGNLAKLTYKEHEYVTIHYEEDYIRLSDEQKDIVSNIIAIGNELTDRPGLYFYNHTTDEEISFELMGGSDNEAITIACEVKLIDNYGWKHGRNEREQRLDEAINRFHDILVKVQNEELNLNKPRHIWDNDDMEWHEGSKIQQKLYDYELYC